ncbi:T-complex protein 11-domain-containing protein [Phaeosphaeriaceae sp. PMI808]|nr:T-complex protein 11-domain-containing protein [Phaeosphaeriaceae sp. PMI808]
MNTRIPKAAGRKAPFRAGHSYSTPPADAMITEGDMQMSPSPWHKPTISRDGPTSEEIYPNEHLFCTEAQRQEIYPSPCKSLSPPSTLEVLDFPEELAQMIKSTHEPDDLRGLADAFGQASKTPPITQQSLSELDINTIIANIKLRHNVNFDRDVSFRPNFDGDKGIQKRMEREKYWTALEAELELYATLFQDTPFSQHRKGSHWVGLTQHAKCRIPIIFKTIQDVLKSLVPEHDHARVDEHLDVSMLMQEIERGVCDLVRLAEWMAQLLKEHCAPMRDAMVDSMVNSIREGVANQSSTQIVRGLRELLGILEAMKLDVANHQIKNLKTLLIEDTIKFEKRHHLDVLLSPRPHISIENAQTWYVCAARDFAELYPTQPRDIPHAQFEVFARAVVAQFFKRGGYHGFPDTFYLDQDRLQNLQAETEDLVHMEICMDSFTVLLKQIGHDGSVPLSSRYQLHTSLLAIMGDAICYGSQKWFQNSEALSLEILRQASLVARQTVTYSHDTLSDANELLCSMFSGTSGTQNTQVQGTLVQLVLACTKRYVNSSPSDLFHNLAPVTNTILPSRTHFPYLHKANTSSSPQAQSLEASKWQDVSNRISHIILLHWRVWDCIAYVQDDSERAMTPIGADCATLSPQARAQTSESKARVIIAIRSRDGPECGQENHVAQQTPSR